MNILKLYSRIILRFDFVKQKLYSELKKAKLTQPWYACTPLDISSCSWIILIQLGLESSEADNSRQIINQKYWYSDTVCDLWNRFSKMTEGGIWTVGWTKFFEIGWITYRCVMNLWLWEQISLKQFMEFHFVWRVE